MLETIGLDGPLLILSPHLDDAVLSVGGIMELAGKRGNPVLAATIFTADAPDCMTSSPTVQELHALWALGQNPYAIRREEDIAAIRSLGCDYLHGNMLDSIYRRDDAGAFFYADRKAVFLEPSPRDNIWEPLRKLLAEWITTIQPSVILCPLAVGQHVDHVITSEALRTLGFEDKLNVFLYEDMPYSAGLFPPGRPDTVPAALGRSAWSVGTSITIPVDAERKTAAVMEYKSQIAHLFPDRQLVEQELKRYMLLGSEKTLGERLWSV